MAILNKIIYPSKIWHCVVLFLLIVLVDVIFFEVSILLGYNMHPDHYSECFLMFCFMTISSVIYYKNNSSKLSLTLIVGHVRGKEFLIYLLLFLLFASSTVLLNPQSRGEIIDGVTSIDIVVFYLFFLFAAIGEELLFRGVFINGLQQTYRNNWSVIFVVSIIFGLAHADTLYHVFSAFMSSMLLGVVYCKTNSLMLCVLMHLTGDLLMNCIFEWYGNGHYLLGGILLVLSLFGYSVYILSRCDVKLSGNIKTTTKNEKSKFWS